MTVTCCVFTILFWDCLCRLANTFGIGLLLLMDQDHEGGRRGGEGDDTGDTAIDVTVINDLLSVLVYRVAIDGGLKGGLKDWWCGS